MLEITKLATYEGQMTKKDNVTEDLLWRSDKDMLGEALENVMSKLLELKSNPYGIPLQRVFDDDHRVESSNTTLVDIQHVYIEEVTRELVATLKMKDQQTLLGDDEKGLETRIVEAGVSEVRVDEALEDTFPASDPPALKTTT
ncbi:MAG: hypothetical protein ACRCYY_03605 [Trueperaceae bacterium]